MPPSRSGLALLALSLCACAHGSTSAAERQAVIEAHLPEIQACWSDVAEGYPGASGSVTFTVDIRRNGTVDWADVDVDEIGAPKLLACAIRRIKKWRFPAGDRQTIGFGVGFVAP